MSRDFTLFQFDLDEATVRRILSSIPGVTPLPPDDEEAPAADDIDADADSTATGTTRPSDRPGPVGSEAHIGDESTEPPSGTAASGGPSTPWPGAPTDEAESEADDEGLLGRFGGKRLLIAVGLVLGLGVIGVAVVWFVKQRDDGESDPSTGAATGPSVGREETDAADSGPERDEEPSSADDESRSYPIDPGPIVGMGFLAVGTLVLRHFRSGDETAA